MPGDPGSITCFVRILVGIILATAALTRLDVIQPAPRRCRSARARRPGAALGARKRPAIRTWTAGRGRSAPSGVEHLAEHVLQDAAVLVVVRLAGSVDTHVGVELHTGVRADADRAGDLPVVE